MTWVTLKWLKMRHQSVQGPHDYHSANLVWPFWVFVLQNSTQTLSSCYRGASTETPPTRVQRQMQKYPSLFHEKQVVISCILLFTHLFQWLTLVFNVRYDEMSCLQTSDQLAVVFPEGSTFVHVSCVDLLSNCRTWRFGSVFGFIESELKKKETSEVFIITSSSHYVSSCMQWLCRPVKNSSQLLWQTNPLKSMIIFSLMIKICFLCTQLPSRSPHGWRNARHQGNDTSYWSHLPPVRACSPTSPAPSPSETERRAFTRQRAEIPYFQ